MEPKRSTNSDSAFSPREMLSSTRSTPRSKTSLPDITSCPPGPILSTRDSLETNLYPIHKKESIPFFQRLMLSLLTGEQLELSTQLRTNFTVDLAGHSQQPLQFSLLISSKMESSFPFLNNRLFPAIPIVLVATVVLHPWLSIISSLVPKRPSLTIHTPQEKETVVLANKMRARVK